MPVGSTFVPESDTLRSALDSALTSPYGLAVAVAPGTGRFAGVACAQAILAQVADARIASTESVELRPGRDVRPEADLPPEPVDELDATTRRALEHWAGAEPGMRPEPDEVRR